MKFMLLPLFKPMWRPPIPEVACAGRADAPRRRGEAAPASEP